MDRYHLRYFLSVIDTGNFSRAAAACNVSQPTLSVGIAKLEKMLGATLFNRSNRRVELTAAGARLAPYARAIEGRFAEAERDVAGVHDVRVLRLGVLVSTPRRWVERLMQNPRAREAFDRIEIVEGRERELRERLARGRIDAALTVLRAGDEERDRRHVLTEGYSLALPVAHPASGAGLIRAEELMQDAMIVRRHCELLAETSRFFTARGVRPFFSARTYSDDRALSYVRAGMGVTIMPDCFAEAGVARVPLEGFEFTREIGLLYASHADDAVRHEGLVAALHDGIVPVR